MESQRDSKYERNRPLALRASPGQHYKECWQPPKGLFPADSHQRTWDLSPTTISN